MRCCNHHPTTARGFVETVNWNLKGAIEVIHILRYTLWHGTDFATPTPSRCRASHMVASNCRAVQRRVYVACATGVCPAARQQKAQLAGVVAVLVDPKHTSQQCHAYGQVAGFRDRLNMRDRRQ